MKLLLAGLAAALAALASASASLAAPGDLDPTFGAGGRVTLDIPGGWTAGMVLQPDGKLIAAGTTGSRDFVVARFNSDGSLDTGFAADGIAITDAGDEFDDAEALALQPDGKIVVVGDNGAGVVAARYNSNGSLDATFDGDGIATYDFGDQVGGSDVAVQDDGKILVLGVADFLLARLNADGSLDTSFGSGGSVTTDFGGTFDQAAALAVQSDGKIVAVGGTGDDLATFDFAVARYLADGTLDSSFSGDGKQMTDFGGDFDYDDYAEDVAIQSDGKIVVAGGRWQSARYLADGTLDNGFGMGGKQETVFGGGQFARAVAVQSDGKIVTAGGDGDNFALTRYDASGILDPEFGIGGKQTTAFTGGSSAALSAAIQADGKIVLAGNGSQGLVMARYSSEGDTEHTTPTTSTPQPTQPRPQPAAPTLPRILGVELSRKTMRLTGPARGRRAVLTLRVSRQARVAIQISKIRGGVRKGKRCLKRIPDRTGRVCDLPIARLDRPMKAGANRIALTPRIGGKRLTPGRYRLTLRVGSQAPRSLVVRVAR